MARATSQAGKQNPHYSFSWVPFLSLLMSDCVSAIDCIQIIMKEFLEELLTMEEDVKLGRW